jgi:tRNA(fMet)-specific endonuclease VapC
VTAAELLLGVELADASRHATRLASVERVLAAVPVEPYDLDVARAHARLLAHTRRQGRVRGAHELLIAATACATGRTVLTADRAAFDDLPDVAVREL